ncbi:MAG TPA: hypothetical protein VG474_02735, partial [Solirubrobacteraceae bacterium]|nr:hypothetical protein [Solirubrobacteraceae bacterium]
MTVTARPYRLLGAGFGAVALALALQGPAGAQEGAAQACPNETQPAILGTAAADRLNGTPAGDRILAGSGED